MNKYLYLNKDNVIIDIVDLPKYVRRNSNNLTILCSPGQAQGLVGSDNETVYAMIGTQFIPSYSDIAGVVPAEISGEIVPLKYKYEDGRIVKNTDAYPETNIELTAKTDKNASDIDYIAMMTDVEL